MTAKPVSVKNTKNRRNVPNLRTNFRNHRHFGELQTIGDLRKIGDIFNDLKSFKRDLLSSIVEPGKKYEPQKQTLQKPYPHETTHHFYPPETTTVKKEILSPTLGHYSSYPGFVHPTTEQP